MHRMDIGEATVMAQQAVEFGFGQDRDPGDAEPEYEAVAHELHHVAGALLGHN